MSNMDKTIKTIIQISGVVALLILLGITVYTINDQNIKYGIKRITQFSHFENDYVAIDISILAERRADFIFPTDKLAYLVNWKNKMNQELVANATIDGTIGENKSFEKPKTYSTTINKNDNVTESYDFSLDKEGRHRIYLNLQIYNYTNRNILSTYETPPTTIEILSRSEQLQEESNFWTITGIIISSSISATALIFVGYETISHRHETRQTFRPWLSRDKNNAPPSLRIDDPRPGVVGHSNPNGLPEPPLLIIRIINNGTIPAKGIRTFYWLNLNTAENNIFLPLGNGHDLAKDETFVSRIVLDHNQYIGATVNTLFYGYKIEYTDINNTRGSYELIGKFEARVDELINVTIE